MKKAMDKSPLPFCLDSSKFVVFKFETVAHVHAKGQQSNGNLGNNAGVIVLHIGVISTDVGYSAEHKILL